MCQLVYVSKTKSGLYSNKQINEYQTYLEQKSFDEIFKYYI